MSRIKFDWTINIAGLLAVIGILSTLSVSIYRVAELEKEHRALRQEFTSFAKSTSETLTRTATRLEDHLH